MKVEIKNKDEEVDQFPVLMISKENSHIVLFFNLDSGIVMSGGSLNFSFGYYSSSWSPAYDYNQWEQFTGEITLKND